MMRIHEFTQVWGRDFVHVSTPQNLIYIVTQFIKWTSWSWIRSFLESGTLLSVGTVASVHLHIFLIELSRGLCSLCTNNDQALGCEMYSHVRKMSLIILVLTSSKHVLDRFPEFILCAKGSEGYRPSEPQRMEMDTKHSHFLIPIIQAIPSSNYKCKLNKRKNEILTAADNCNSLNVNLKIHTNTEIFSFHTI